MYTASINAEHDPRILQQFIRDNPLCALITQTAAGMVASHIPMVLHGDPSGFGILRGHVARANPQWHTFTSPEAFGIFTGPQHYISASWYPSKATHGREVPTWNYAAVHVYGNLQIIEDEAWLLQHLRSLTDTHEANSETPWSVDDAPPDFIAKLSKAIVGIELPIARVEGKCKVSQNRSESDMKDLVLSRRPNKT
jgi:transcriptional regulator